LRAPLHTFALFHLNLAFSSIEEEQRATVVHDCYTPLLDLAERHYPIAIEASAYTLKAIAACDSGWISRLSKLIRARKVEFVGSGYAQAIGPLLPADMVATNLRLGNQAYEELLGLVPTVALVNEQAYSAGLVGHYLDAGYRALLVDWDNVANFHPGWKPEFRYAPQRAVGSDGREISILWTNTVAFQKLQRLAHEDIALHEYLAFLESQRGDRPRVLNLYASDVEIFGFRPGRYRSEETNQGAIEWQRIDEAFEALKSLDNVRMVSPSEALQIEIPESGRKLSLETAAYPVPVKKQRKYNLTRWAVSGSDDIGINAACQRIYGALKRAQASDDDWRELCRLWASDFRTHITPARWERYCRDLAAMETRLGTAPAESLPATPAGKIVCARFLDIETPTLRARVDRRRGLAIQFAAFAPDFVPLIGGLPHGTFDDISLQADWYTGDCVFETPGEAKVTDLDWAESWIEPLADGGTRVHGKIATPLGPIVKVLTFQAKSPRIDFDLEFQWEDWGRGVLRLGHITLLGEAFDHSRLSYATHNGGRTPEHFALDGLVVEHGTPVSFLVSASCGLGATEGWIRLADDRHAIDVSIDRETAPLIGLVNHRKAGDKLFCQLLLSALELDDTRKPKAYRQGPRRFRFSIDGERI
jgi:Glycosyl hydrolase family 57